jgi:hypothetical protein
LMTRIDPSWVMFRLADGLRELYAARRRVVLRKESDHGLGCSSSADDLWSSSRLAGRNVEPGQRISTSRDRSARLAATRHVETQSRPPDENDDARREIAAPRPIIIRSGGPSLPTPFR